MNIIVNMKDDTDRRYTDVSSIVEGDEFLIIIFGMDYDEKTGRYNVPVHINREYIHDYIIVGGGV